MQNICESELLVRKIKYWIRNNVKNTELFTEQYQNIKIYTEQFHASMSLLFQNTGFYTEVFHVFLQENKKKRN